MAAACAWICCKSAESASGGAFCAQAGAEGRCAHNRKARNQLASCCAGILSFAKRFTETSSDRGLLFPLWLRDRFFLSRALAIREHAAAIPSRFHVAVPA